MRQSASTVTKLAHFWSDTRNTQWHEIKGAVGETVETLRVPTSPQGEHSLAESLHDHWWRLPDVFVGAKNSTGFPGTCWKNQDTIKANACGFSIVSTITECWHTKFRHVRYVYFSESLQKHWKSIANCQVEDWEASNGHTKDTTRLFHGPWHDAVGEYMCAQPFRMWNRIHFHMFMQVSQIFQRHKSNKNKQDFENKLDLTCQAQSTPKTVEILTKVFCTSGPNFVVLAWTGDELSRGQAQNGEILTLKLNLTLKVKVNHPPKQ